MDAELGGEGEAERMNGGGKMAFTGTGCTMGGMVD